MRKQGTSNGTLIKAIANLGHTEFMVICDIGLPIPADVPTLDLSLSRGIPQLLDVLKTISEELVVERYITASELADPKIQAGIRKLLSETVHETVTHEKFKELTHRAKFIIRTGEQTPYANIILVGGTNF